MDYIETNINAYNIAALQYEERIKTNSVCEVDAQTLFSLVDTYVLNKAYPKMLEIGPGNGQLIRLFAEAGYETVGIDFSNKMLKIAKMSSPETKFINANVLECEFPEDYFDVVYAAAVIHCFQKNDAKLLLEKIYKWLKRQTGIFYVHTTLEKISKEGFEKKEDYQGNIIRYRKRYTQKEFSDMLLEHKFDIINISYRQEKNRNKLWQCYICKI